MSTEGTPDPASQPSEPVGGDATPSAEAPAPEPAEPEAVSSYPPAEPGPSSYPPAEPGASSYPPAEPGASSYPPAEPGPASSYPPPEYGQPPYAPPYAPGGPAAPGYQQPGYQQPGYQQPGYQAPPAPGYGYQQPAYPPAYGPTPLSPSDERLWATLAHVGPILTSFLAPLLIWLILRERSRFVDDQGKEALNFQIFLAIVYVVGAILTVIIVGFAIIFAAWVVSIVFGIQGAIVAGRGEPYRYPLSWRVIK